MDTQIPKDWRRVVLRSVCEPTRIWNPVREPRDEFWYVDVSAVSRQSLTIQAPQRVKAAQAPSRARKLIQAGDTIFATVRPTLRRIAFVGAEFNNQIASTAFCIVRAKREEAVPRFLYYALQTDLFNEEVAKRQSGASYPAVNDKDVLNQLIALPLQPEQEKIAAALWKIQRAIEVEEKLVATSRELKEAAVHQLFAHGLRAEAQKETDLGPAPRSWEICTLAELLDIRHGYAFQGQFFAPSGKYVLLTPGHFHEHGGFRDQGDKTKYYTGPFPPEYLLGRGDMLIAMTEQTSGLLGSAIILPESGKFLHNQRLGLVTNLEQTRLSKLFLYYFLARPEVRHRIEQTATGSKVRHTSPGRIRDLPITLPTTAEQIEIAHILQTLDRKIAFHESKRAALSGLFQTILHQLMTAQIRVDNLDIDTSEVVA